MGFLEGVKTFVSGKSTEQRMKEAEYNKKIQMEISKAEMEERRAQNIRIAREQVRIKANARLKQIKSKYEPRQTTFGFNVASPEYKSYGTPFGAPRTIKTRKVVKKGKVKKVKVVPKYNIREQIKPQRYDVLGW